MVMVLSFVFLGHNMKIFISAIFILALSTTASAQNQNLKGSFSHYPSTLTGRAYARPGYHYNSSNGWHSVRYGPSNFSYRDGYLPSTAYRGGYYPGMVVPNRNQITVINNYYGPNYYGN